MQKKKCESLHEREKITVAPVCFTAYTSKLISRTERFWQI